MSEGFMSGFIEGSAAGQREQIMGLQRQEMQQDIKLNDLKIQSAQKAITVQEQIMAKFSSMTSNSKGQPTPGELVNQGAEMMLMYGVAQASSGQPTAASASLKTASTLLRNQAYIDKQQNDIQIRNLGIVQNEINPDTIKSQADFDAAQQRIELITGHKSPYQGQQYSPELVKAIHNNATTSKDQALIKERLSAAKVNETKSKINEYTLDHVLPERVKVDEAREASLRKNGNKQLIPTVTDVSAIKKQASAIFGDGAVADDVLTNASREAAQEAKDLIVNKHIAPAQAYKTAFQHAWKRGDFNGLQPGSKPGSSKFAPLTIPQGAKATDMKDGKYYILNNGTVATWNEATKSFIVPDEPQPDELQPEEGEEPETTGEEGEGEE